MCDESCNQGRSCTCEPHHEGEQITGRVILWVYLVVVVMLLVGWTIGIDIPKPCFCTVIQ